MFDAIGVSERTRKPWTVAVSLIGQVAVVGVAILVPLVGTEALPRAFSVVSVPDPPRALAHRPPAAAAKRVNVVPPQFTAKGLVLPTAIPQKAAIIQDPDFLPPTGGEVGVEGGIGNANGAGSGVIDSLLAARGAAPPPPPPAPKPAPAPAATPRIRLGGVVVESKLISGPQPVYPQIARQARIEGSVRLEAVISREGTVIHLRAVSGHPMLIPAALAAVERWVFRPTYLNGDPVEVATEIEVNFTLRK
jgi:protein TonB